MRSVILLGAAAYAQQEMGCWCDSMYTDGTDPDGCADLAGDDWQRQCEALQDEERGEKGCWVVCSSGPPPDEDLEGPVCDASQEVELRGSMVSPISTITDPGTTRVACPRGYVGDATLLCMNGRVSVAADSCQPVPEGICQAFSAACFGSDGSPQPECKDEKCSSSKMEKIAEDKEEACKKSSIREACKASCGLCDRRLDEKFVV